MAKKQSSKDAVTLLLKGQFTPIVAREITEEIEERVLKTARK